jgi:predicted metal-dependent hydrolase
MVRELPQETAMSAPSSSPPALPEPLLSEAERAELARGLGQFNDRLFFECHDTLEEVWSGMRGEPRDFFQGLIQAAVGFYHLGNGNSTGARSVLGRSLTRLARYPPCYAGVELEPLRKALGEWLRALETDTPVPTEPPRIRSLAGDAP